MNDLRAQLHRCFLTACCILVAYSSLAVAQEKSSAPGSATPDSQPVTPSPGNAKAESEQATTEAAPEIPQREVPWDYSPYRVLIWIASDSPEFHASTIQAELGEYLDRDFAAIWRTTIADAPYAVTAAAFRDLDAMDYDMLTAADPVLAVKRNHPEAIRIRVAKNVGEFVKKIEGPAPLVESVKERGQSFGNSELDGVASRLMPVNSDPMTIAKTWASEDTEALLVARGLALTLDEPEAKLIEPPLDDLVSRVIEDYDKVYLVCVRTEAIDRRVEVAELDVLMRHFGSMVTVPTDSGESVASTVGLGVIGAFSPVVRIDDAGQKSATGLLRARGLIIADKSPGLVDPGDVLQPMTRKNDRNGNPFMIGPMDWAYMVADEVEGSTVKMDFYAGRSGGLQGRKNSRTFRMALKVRPSEDETLLRLHAQGDPDFPLIGYEIYERELKSKSMTFVGRTDWNGRLLIDRTDDPLRLLYVKNGGAVLARLPVVPGLAPKAIADLRGDDMRLQAEAYIRGVQNSIIDLVAVRELFKARIRLRLQRGEIEKAEELMDALRKQPSNEELANDMGKRQAEYLKLLGNKNANQRRMVDQMFTTTRGLLTEHINPRLIRELEADLIASRKNGGKLPPDRMKKAEEDED